MTTKSKRRRLKQDKTKEKERLDNDATSTDQTTGPKDKHASKGANVGTGWRHCERDRRLPVRANQTHARGQGPSLS